MPIVYIFFSSLSPSSVLHLGSQAAIHSVRIHHRAGCFFSSSSFSWELFLFLSPVALGFELRQVWIDEEDTSETLSSFQLDDSWSAHGLDYTLDGDRRLFIRQWRCKGHPVHARWLLTILVQPIARSMYTYRQRKEIVSSSNSVFISEVITCHVQGELWTAVQTSKSNDTIVTFESIFVQVDKIEGHTWGAWLM